MATSCSNLRPDIVYLWVNGQDPEWQRRRESAEKKYYGSRSCRFSNVDGRFRDNDELRFSLRSLTPYLDQFGRIFIVTDRQRPAWLVDHPRISIVDHDLLRDDPEYPTYSSKALEAYFDRLPTSNHFVYLNDDVFLGGAFSMDDLHDSALQKTVVHFEQVEDRDPLEEASQNSAMTTSHEILSARFDRERFSPQPMAHAPRYLIRNFMKELFETYPAAVREARREIFREPAIPSVVADLYGRWMLASGYGIEKPVEHTLLSSGAPLFDEQLETLATRFRSLSYFCINDTLDNTSGSHSRFSLIQSVLEEMFPMPSEFEIIAAAPLDENRNIHTGMLK